MIQRTRLALPRAQGNRVGFRIVRHMEKPDMNEPLFWFKRWEDPAPRLVRRYVPPIGGPVRGHFLRTNGAGGHLVDGAAQDVCTGKILLFRPGVDLLVSIGSSAQLTPDVLGKAHPLDAVSAAARPAWCA